MATNETKISNSDRAPSCFWVDDASRRLAHGPLIADRSRSILRCSSGRRSISSCSSASLNQMTLELARRNKNNDERLSLYSCPVSSCAGADQLQLLSPAAQLSLSPLLTADRTLVPSLPTGASHRPTARADCRPVVARPLCAGRAAGAADPRWTTRRRLRTRRSPADGPSC